MISNHQWRGSRGIERFLLHFDRRKKKESRFVDKGHGAAVGGRVFAKSARLKDIQMTMQRVRNAFDEGSRPCFIVPPSLPKAIGCVQTAGSWCHTPKMRMGGSCCVNVYNY